MRRGAVLTFGESINDARAVAELLVAANADLAGRVHARPRPVSLTRAAGLAAQRKWVQNLQGTVTAFEATQGAVAAVVVHRDADGHDPYGTVESDMNAALTPLSRAFAVVPVQMTEAWWFLFPDAVESVRPKAWRGVMPRKAVDVETIVDPKQKLIRLTRRQGTEYSEADSVAIAECVRVRSLNPLGVSASHRRFSEMAKRLR